MSKITFADITIQSFIELQKKLAEVVECSERLKKLTIELINMNLEINDFTVELREQKTGDDIARLLEKFSGDKKSAGNQ